MQSKGLVLPRHPLRTDLNAIKYSTNPSRVGECLTNNFHRDIHSRRLDAFKIYTTTPEQSDPSPEAPPSESTEVNKEFVSLSSWAEDISQPTSTDDWGPPPVKSRPPGRHPIMNALFTLSLGGIAVGAFFLGRKYNAYNQAMKTEPIIAQVGSTRNQDHERKDTTPAANVVKTDDTATAAPNQIYIRPTLPRHKETKLAPDNSKKRIIESEEKDTAVKIGEEKMQERDKLPSPPAANAANEGEGAASMSKESEVEDALPSPSLLFDSAVKEEEKKEAQEPLPSKEAATVAEKEEGKNEDEDIMPKLPLRTAEAEAALDRIRAIQQRRQYLYDRAIARQENKLKPLSTISTEAAGETLGEMPSRSPKLLPVPSGSRHYNEEEEEIEREIDDESTIEALNIPKGMSLVELRERAIAANKAAAASATAAHRAATASALAADAADTATRAAHQASLAAAQCQGALDMRSVDAIEVAFKAAKEAEEKAETASRKAAVNSAKAIISKRDAEKKEEIASKAASLSTPHGIVAQTSAFWRQLRRDGSSAKEKTQENLQAGVAAAGWMWNQGIEKVHFVGKGTIGGVHNAWKAVQERLPAPGDTTARNGKDQRKGPATIEKKEEVQRGWFGRSRVKK